MSEDDAPRVKGQQALHPFAADIHVTIAMTVTNGSSRQDVGTELRRSVMALAGHNNGPIRLSDHDGLAASRMPGSRDHVDTLKHLGATIKYLIVGPRGIDEIGEGVVGLSSGFELASLDKDGSTGQLGVTSAVVEMQVAIDYLAYIAKTSPRSGESSVKSDAAGPAMSVDIGM